MLGGLRDIDATRLRDVVIDEQQWRAECDSLTFGPQTEDRARRHLLSYLLHRYEDAGHSEDGEPYSPGWVHAYICERLEQFCDDIDAGKQPRLILTMPPRGGKSQIASRTLPAWYMGTRPHKNVAVCSYSAELAHFMSSEVKRIRDVSLDIFPHLAPDPDGVNRRDLWDTVGGGTLMAAGVGGPITGRGYSLGIIDDYFKNMQEADSPAVRATIWDWYLSTFYTRKAPKAGILVIATRWHSDGLIGRLLEAAKKGGDQWELLEFPAIAREDEYHPTTGKLFRRKGEVLHSKRYSQEQVEKTRATLAGSRVWPALYMCRPVSTQGKLFRRQWYNDRYEFDPQRPPRPWMEVGISIDCNFKKPEESKGDEDTASYVSIGVWGRWDYSEFYRLDESRARYSFWELLNEVSHIARKWRPNFILIEEAANGHALISMLKTVVSNVIAFKVSEYGSKNARAEVASPTHSAGAIRLPVSAPWADDWVDEHVDFPAGKANDRVDESSQLVIYWVGRSHDAGTTDAVMKASRALLGVFGH